MAWYRTGTVALTNGSATVTGTGTAFIANAEIGEGLVAPDGRMYEIQAIVSDTQLTLARTYLGATASGQSYAIAPIRGRIADLIGETQSLLASFATVRDGIGAGLFPDGTVSLPGFRFAADQDTGIHRPGSNTLGIITGGVQRVTVDGNGNVGVGTTSLTARFTINGGSGASQTRFQVSTADVEEIATNAAANAYANRVTDAAQHVYKVSSNERLRINASGHILPGFDNGQNIGSGSLRWSTIFAGTGTINTSDAREKIWRGAPDEAAIRAANRIIGELGFFQWKDAVEEKGEDGARIHFGLKAQDVIRVMIEEGLEDEQELDFAPGKFVPAKSRPSFRHAFLCFDTWENTYEPEVVDVEVPFQEPTGLLDENGVAIMRAATRIERRATGKTVLTRKAGNRFGLRVDQLTMFLLAALASRVAALESKKR